MGRERLTPTRIGKARPQAGKSTYLWDVYPVGFGVRLHPSGRKVFIASKGNLRRKIAECPPAPSEAEIEAARQGAIDFL